MHFNTLLLEDENIKQIIDILNKGKKVTLAGLTDSRFSYFIGNILNKITGNILLVVEDNLKIDNLYEDLLRVFPENKVIIFPEIEVLPHELVTADFVEIKERLKVIQQLAFSEESDRVIITSVSNLLRKLMPVKLFREYTIKFKLDKVLDFKDISARLTILGYERVNMVENPGQFSIRGGILDIYTIVADNPYRIELFGDEIDSIRSFDPNTQRSINDLEEVVISPVQEFIIKPNLIKAKLPVIKEDFNNTIKKLQTVGYQEEAVYLAEKRDEVLEKFLEEIYFPGYQQYLPYFINNFASLLDYLKGNSMIFYADYSRVWQRLKLNYREIAETQASLLEQGSILPSYEKNFFSIDELKNRLIDFTELYSYYQSNPDKQTGKVPNFSFETRGVEPYHGQIEMFAETVEDYINNQYTVVITLNSISKTKRIAEFLQEKGISTVVSKDKIKRYQANVRTGSFSTGFIFEEIKLAVFTEREIFGKEQKKKRKLKDIEKGIKISSINELVPGDFVVHENHGIGKYLGVQTMEMQDKHQDYLVIKYAGEDKLYVPTDQVNLVQKYIGADQGRPKLYKLGGNEWRKIKQKVKDSVREMAIGLLELYAERETVRGYAFSEDSIWQKEFEEAFPYQETPDQMKAIEEVKSGMEEDTPMDCLLCGDVGYGKTEVAIRAAFKAVMDGKQVAVLVPTTILAQQHFNTFRERMENYPVQIEMISRFKTPAQQRETLKKLVIGKVDIIIGTHRLLSKDIIFNDLGLLIVDEEQRFGVSHKERLKDIKRNVDVLTLTATPIPRTLHMALVGVRDMSVIETPPENRYPIRTYIREFNRDLIRDALRKELSRNGQVYFVHNRVEDIEEKADMIRKLVPESRVAVAHGQMNEHRLEKLMLNFYNKEYDVLVCTTIIETGLDIPNVNTIIINKADQMGLAQLYQLRGRVGRTNRVAYAYLLYEKDRILPEIAEKRLRAIKEFTNLGSGFKIAMRDLEIRGAGNLLGPEQHGHIASIGFSLYCKLLEQAVEDLRGRDVDNRAEVEIKINLDAYIPDDYITDSRQKIEIYKKIMGVRKEEDYSELIDEIIDRFGEPPEVVMNLVKISKIKLKASKLGINKIMIKKKMYNLHFSRLDKFKGEVVIKLIELFPGKIRVKSGNQPILMVRTEDIDVIEKVLIKFMQLAELNKP